MSHNITDVLETHIQRKREELERLQQAMAMIPQVQSDLAAMERTLAILGGKTAIEQPSSGQSYDPPQEPYPQLAQAILREQGTPLTGDQITHIARSKGKPVSRSSLMGALYRCSKEKKFFKLVAPGTFGLLDWENHSDEREENLLVPSQDISAVDDPLRENAPSGSPNGAF